MYRDFSCVYTTPPPRWRRMMSHRKRRAATARGSGRKMDGPAWGLSLSTLNDSWRSPKNFGELETTTNGPL